MLVVKFTILINVRTITIDLLVIIIIEHFHYILLLSIEYSQKLMPFGFHLIIANSRQAPATKNTGTGIK